MLDIQKTYIGEIKELIKELDYRIYLRFVEPCYINIHVARKEKPEEHEFGFSYKFSTKEDLKIILKSLGQLRSD